jgi:hypothetical protein
MPRTDIRSLRGHLFRQPKSVAGKVISRAVQPFLQRAAGIKRLADRLSLARERLLSLQLEVGRQAPQSAHLVAHFAGRRLRRPDQSRIQRSHPLQQRRQAQTPAPFPLPPSSAYLPPAWPGQLATAPATPVSHSCKNPLQRQPVPFLSSSPIFGSIRVAEKRGSAGVARPSMRS